MLLEWHCMLPQLLHKHSSRLVDHLFLQSQILLAPVIRYICSYFQALAVHLLSA